MVVGVLGQIDVLASMDLREEDVKQVIIYSCLKIELRQLIS
jgi:hypothetical protein